MRITPLFIWLFALLALGSCSQDLEPELPGQSLATQTEQIDISLGTEQDDDSLRAIYNLATDGSGQILGLDRISTSDKLRIRVYIRRYNAHGDITGRSTSDLIFTKESGRNYATYTGKLDVPVRTATSDTYKIAAALLGEGENAGDPNYTELFRPQQHAEMLLLRFHPDRRDKMEYNLVATSPFAMDDKIITEVSGLKKFATRMPYITDWQDFPRATSQLTTKVVLKFKALGTVFRFRIKNNTTQDLKLYQLHLQSTEFDNFAFFDFFNGDSPRSSPGSVDPYPVDISHISTIAFYTYDHPYIPTTPIPGDFAGRRHLIVPSGQYSPWQYLVMYPRVRKSTGVPAITALMSADIYSDGRYLEPIYTTDKIPSQGWSVPVTIEYNGPDTTYDYLKVRPAPGSASRPAKLALDYVAQSDFSQDGSHLVGSGYGGRFSYEEAMAKFALPRVIGGVKYSLPSRNELASIFPPWEPGMDTRGFDSRYRPSSLRALDRVERDIQIGNEPPRTYLSTYLMGNNTSEPYELYAIRFQDQTDKNRTAFRYQLLNGLIRVDCVWLGASTDTVEDLLDLAFWYSRPASEVVTRVFSLNGLELYNSIQEVGTAGGYWTSTTIGNGCSYAFWHYSQSAVTTCPDVVRLPVRPFIRD